MLKFNLKKNFDKLVGVGLSGNEGHWVVLKAMQQTRFLLNDAGARVEAEAEIELGKSGYWPREHTKHLIFNKPFTVIMRKKGRHQPYLMVKVENTELMVK